ncbi:clostripain-related cysteine peptidase [Pyxidicoccus caerfyrddinensis]|uniref:clostripain-related cysteine peptidase n=1 Tax=Pyxidicoccus caerfyrddinensis TaxID=2709663 RepID=UPI0013DD39C1|nr:clostripain-related cysteine peptidase [Pyxidicoccus caerfyrddinensis]
MVWMAGDNNLEDAALDDLAELKQAGSTEEVDILVQMDRMSDQNTRRYHVRRGTSTQADVVEELGPTNTGDPQCAINFFTWGIQHYPARRYLVVLWNHGSGIDESDVYDRMQQLGMTVSRRAQRTRGAIPLGRVHAAMSRGYSRALFSTTVEAAMKQRAIGYDDTARDFLDNMELKRVLLEVKKATGRRIDLVGFDACLMNMIELAYELRSTTDFVVGSEETEPGDGWPYDVILKELVQNPKMTTRELGSVIVQRYVESYPGEAVTQSLLDLRKSPSVAEAVDELAAVLLKLIKKPEGKLAVQQAMKDTQAFAVTEFIDLGDMIAQLLKQLKKVAPALAEKVASQLAEGPLRSFVVAEAHRGDTMRRATGVSIYCPTPRTRISVAYDRLAFARKTRWDDFIAAYA